MLIGQARETDQIVLTRSALKEERSQKKLWLFYVPLSFRHAIYFRIIIRSSVLFNILADEPEGWTERDAKSQKKSGELSYAGGIIYLSDRDD